MGWMTKDSGLDSWQGQEYFRFFLKSGLVSVLCNGYQEIISLRYSTMSMPRLRMVELYFHSHMCLNTMVLNQLINYYVLKIPFLLPTANKKETKCFIFAIWNACKILVKNSEGKRHLGDRGVNGSILLIWMLKKLCGKVWT
jgi:hypothetical protein